MLTLLNLENLVIRPFNYPKFKTRTIKKRLKQSFIWLKPALFRFSLDLWHTSFSFPLIAATTVAKIRILVVVILCLLKKKSFNALIFFSKKQNQTIENIEAFLRNYGPFKLEDIVLRILRKWPTPSKKN